MKINIRTFAIAFSSIAVLAFSSEVIAIENLEVTSIENSRMIRMETSAPGNSSFDIFLMDKRNRSIYQERVDMGSSFEKVFDFTGFKDGTYTLVSEMENMRLNRVFEVKGNEVNLKESFYSFIPRFKFEDGRLLVHYINNGKEDIDITLTGGSGDLFSSNFDGDDLIFHKTFLTEDLMGGLYTLKFSARGETFRYDFEIN